MDFQLLEKLGFVFLSGFFIKFFMDEFKKHGEERKIWAELFASQTKATIEHNQRACDFQTHVQAEHTKMIERLEKMGEEHKEMIVVLGRINGYREEH